MFWRKWCLGHPILAFLLVYLGWAYVGMELPKRSEVASQKTVTIPGGVLRIASKLIPKQATNYYFMGVLEVKRSSTRSDRGHVVQNLLIHLANGGD